MTRTTELLKEIHNELEKGIKRNGVLPLDWAMDRIEPIVEKELNRSRLDALKEINTTIDEQIKTMDSFYDNGYYVGNIEFIKELPKAGEMIEARIHALNILKASIQEEIKLIEEKI